MGSKITIVADKVKAKAEGIGRSEIIKKVLSSHAEVNFPSACIFIANDNLEMQKEIEFKFENIKYNIIKGDWDNGVYISIEGKFYDAKKVFFSWAEKV